VDASVHWSDCTAELNPRVPSEGFLFRARRQPYPTTFVIAFRVGHLSGAFSFSRRVMRGQITFFDFKKHFGIIIAEVSGEQHFFSGHDLAEPVKRNDWVEFDSEPNSKTGNNCDWVATNVRRIECPSEFLLYGYIHNFFPDKH
jgi:hypothetical protein